MLMQSLASKIRSELDDVILVVDNFDNIKDKDQRTIQLAVAEICILAAMEGLRTIKRLHDASLYEEETAAEPPPPTGQAISPPGL